MRHMVVSLNGRTPIWTPNFNSHYRDPQRRDPKIDTPNSETLNSLPPSLPEVSREYGSTFHKDVEGFSGDDVGILEE